ncbi:LOW QUALITY PROTEIN: taste receptor type 2 member 134-like [Dama dama]
MPALPTLIFKVIFFLESLAAMLENDFIVTVLSGERTPSRTLPAGDMIVACQAASQFCLHGMALLNLMASSGFCSKIYCFSIPWGFISSLSFWLTAWLAVSYCAEISLFSPVFWMKWKISQSVPQLLLASLILSGLTIISSAAGNTILAQMTAAQSSCGNDTLAGRIHAVYLRFFLPRVILVWSVPFLLFLVSTALLWSSLRRRLRQMRDRRPSPRDPSTRAHTMALKSLAFFLLFCTLYSLPLDIIMYIPALWKHWRWACEVVTYAGICPHSSILVRGSPTLRKTLKKSFAEPWTRASLSPVSSIDSCYHRTSPEWQERTREDNVHCSKASVFEEQFHLDLCPR